MESYEAVPAEEKATETMDLETSEMLQYVNFANTLTIV